MAAFDARSAAGANQGHILVRSSWQTVNIGDIGHTPGLLRLLETHLPGVKVTLWPNKVDRGVREMLLAGFPWLTIVEGSIGKDGRPSNPALADAWERAGMLLHGSGPSVVARRDVAAWRRFTDKPYGIYGVTVDGGLDDDLRDLLTQAAFVFCRDTTSLKHITGGGVAPPVMKFGPDATFGFHLRDDANAAKWLEAARLPDAKFVCAIPRLRFTPYHKIHHREPTDEDRRKAAVSEKHRSADHGKLRDALAMLLRETDALVAAVPEMVHEMEVAKAELVDAMPEDLRPRVSWRESYWRPDEAASVYARALAVVSFEMHSPILAAAMGTPAIYLRQPTDSCKGQMWRDIGLSDWIFEAETMTGEEIGRALLAIARDPVAARAKMAKAMAFVRERQRDTMAVVARTVRESPGKL